MRSLSAKFPGVTLSSSKKAFVKSFVIDLIQPTTEAAGAAEEALGTATLPHPQPSEEVDATAPANLDETVEDAGVDGTKTEYSQLHGEVSPMR
jgi:hypothetical protein